jgi:hypothetical protein
MCPTVFPRSEIVTPVHLHIEDLATLYRILASQGVVHLECDDIEYTKVEEIASERSSFDSIRISLTPRRGKHRILVVILDSLRSAAEIVWTEGNQHADRAAGKVLNHLKQQASCAGNVTTGLVTGVRLTAAFCVTLVLASGFLSAGLYVMLAASTVIIGMYLAMRPLGLMATIKPGIHLSPSSRCSAKRKSLRNFMLKVSVPIVAGVVLQLILRLLQLTQT